MVKYFLAYAEEDRELAEQIIGELSDCGLGNAADEFVNENDALKAADCLLVLLTSQKQTALPEIRRRWEFFDGEIRWKRKARGEILLLTEDDGVLNNLPLRLKKCGYYYTDEIADAAQYLEETYGDEEKTEEPPQEPSEPESKYKFPEAKEIKYTPPEEKIESPKYTVKVPGIDPFDGKPIVRSKSQDSKTGGVCKEDHVFEDDFSTPDYTRNQKKNTSTAGCFVIALFIIIMIAVFTSVVFGIAKSCEGSMFGVISGAHVLSGDFDTSGIYGVFANALQTFPIMI